MVIFGIICFIVLTYAISAPSFGGGNCYVAREIKNSKKEELLKNKKNQSVPQKKSEININDVFEDMFMQTNPIERHKTIKDLFVKSGKHVLESGFSENSVRFAVYTSELALHIFALFISNKISALKGKAQAEQYFNSFEFLSFILCLKEFLNLLIENNLNQKGIDKETVKQIVITRVGIILKEKDFEIRNFDFQNLCNLAINYEEDCVFYIGSYEKFSSRVEFDNPLNMMFLPSAYKVGLVDEFLEKLKQTI